MHRTQPDLNLPLDADFARSAPDAAAAGPPPLREPGTIRPGERNFEPADGWKLAGLGAMPPQLAATTRRYTAAWAGLGAISSLYLLIVAWQQTQGVEAALVPVTESLERLATDIADLKRATAAIETRERSTAGRVAAAEQRLDGLGQVASNVPPAGAGTGAAAQAAAQDQRATNRLNLASAAPPSASALTSGLAVAQAGPSTKAPEPASPAKVAPVAKPKPFATTVVAPATNPVRTGSVPAAAAAPAQGVLIASGPSLESVRLSWSVLHDKHGAVLGSLEPRVVPAGDGSAFNLIAGPFASDAEVQAACTSLKAQGVGCKPSVFTGAAL